MLKDYYRRSTLKEYELYVIAQLNSVWLNFRKNLKTLLNAFVNGKKLLKYFQSVEICPKLVTLVATNLGHLEFVEI